MAESELLNCVIHEICLDGVIDRTGLVQYWGIATRQPNGKYHCLANVGGNLCVVEVTISVVHGRAYPRRHDVH